MVITNRDRVGRGLEHLASGLGPFVDARMSAATPNGQDWLDVLAARDRSRFGSERRHSLNDARFLLRVVTEEWRVFRDYLSRVEQSFASELRDTGNKWAHGDEFSTDDTYRALDTMERLLSAVHAPAHAEEVRRLRLGVRPADAEIPARASGVPAQQPPQPAPTQPTGRGVYWSRVTRADVLRAIEEYDELGQDQFLAEHGFGRATAYLLIHNGRSYDSKAILGVAYGFATGTPLVSHEFSGGVHGAAGVLRKLGFEIRDVRGRTGSATAPDPNPPTSAASKPPARSLTLAAHGLSSPAEALRDFDPGRCMLIITCSGSKQPGGQAPSGDDDNQWAPQLREARARVLASSELDITRVLPAWRRYTGTFYQHAKPALADAVNRGHVLVISGGYGILRAEEPIGWYDRQLNLADWPKGVLESALISEAHRCRLDTVVAFASATTGYAQLLRRVPWREAGITARLVTVSGVTGGAMVEVPRRLGQAFSAFSTGQHDSYPPGTTVENLP
ncbi:MAG TPA: Swt1 family HEPN domain-containing protein [Streptosporangiaceae bacterium]|nr:Swt1 family HEPN domain-containing protein [Streptosporangiaceae bacterium]